MYIGLHVKYRYSCQILTKLEFPWQIFEKKDANTKFHENLFSGSQLFHADRWKDGRTDERTDVAKLFTVLRTRPKTIQSIQYRKVQ
jgi:hypothetical protein